MKNNKYVFLGCLATLFFFLCITADIWARAGGGGSYNNSGGGGGDGDLGGLIMIIYYIFALLPFPLNIIVFGIVIVAFLWFTYNKKKKANQKTAFNNIPTGQNNSVKPKDIPLKYAGSTDLKPKVEHAFIKIQQAWQKQDLSEVRKFISDGVYQRFTTQFDIMKVLEQTNVIYDIKIHDISISATREENEFIIVDAAISASITDQYASKKYPQFNQGGTDTFVEYWSFIRKKQVAPTGNLYFSTNCPKCGDELPKDGGEVARCNSCGTMVNSGEYDWVLAEITQTVDYNANGFKKGEATAKKMLEVYKKDPAFSIQMMEDKASNAFLQILASRIKNKAEIARRFVSDTYYTKLEEEVKTDNNKAYVRLYLNHVDLVNGYTQNNMDHLVFNIKYTKQQLQLNGGKGQLLDQAPYTLHKVMVMTRATNAAPAKGQLYAHSCPNCAGPIEDTVDTKCSYCGELLNSPNFEWIVDNVYESQEYKQLRSQMNNVTMMTNANPEDTEKLFKIRDYAFNNILLIVASDGEFKQEEVAYVNKLAKSFKYNEAQVSGWIQLAQQGKLSMIWPFEKEDKQKVYAMMEKAAMADNEIQPAEQQLLDQAKQFLN